jgi:hypothetical protein
MRRGFAIVAPLVLVCTFFALPGRALPAQPPAQLVVRPVEGHAGDTIYLSGAGFPAHNRLAITVACGSGRRPAVSTVTGGPATDARGQFMAYPLQAMRLNVRQPETCRVTARPGSAARSAATFTILPATHPLSPCAVRICVTATAVLVRVRSGTWGNIAIRGWPGARADVRVVPVARHAMARSIRLDWQGAGALRVWVAPGLKQALRARLLVSARLGRFAGSGTGTFAVMPGGR